MTYDKMHVRDGDLFFLFSGKAEKKVRIKLPFRTNLAPGRSLPGWQWQSCHSIQGPEKALSRPIPGMFAAECAT